MTLEQHLQGGCTCGRNHFKIIVPPDATDAAEVQFGDLDNRECEFTKTIYSCSDCFLLSRLTLFHILGHDRSSLLSAFLRVPLPWLQSTTYAYYPDETHSAIRRAFTPWHAPHTKRYFCGFCGTPLIHWSEKNDAEAEMVSVNIGSLKNESVRFLADLGVLPSARDSQDRKEPEKVAISDVYSETGVEIRGQPWFEELIEGSQLGKLRRRRGGNTSADGKTRVEWEVLELNGDDSENLVDGGIGTGKRKHSETVEGPDVVMTEGS